MTLTSWMTILAAIWMAGLSVYLAAHPPKFRSVMGFVILLTFTVVPAGFVAWATVDQQLQSDTVIGELKAEIRGGEERISELSSKLTGQEVFAYVHSRNGVKKDGKFLLDIQAVGSVDNVKIGLYHVGPERETELDWQPVDLRGDNAHWIHSIPAGKWKFYFKAEHTEWVQSLELSELDNTLKQVIHVNRKRGGADIKCCETQYFTISSL